MVKPNELPTFGPALGGFARWLNNSPLAQDVPEAVGWDRDGWFTKGEAWVPLMAELHGLVRRCEGPSDWFLSLKM